ncbi:MAG: hypothetical protein HQ519_13920 [Planctomycetes bacterium]|nr:hypothetical protein [Planctomycetota bacterium]
MAAAQQLIADAGQLVIGTPTSGGPMSDYFSLILPSTAGCHLLPSIDELVKELRISGFVVERRSALRRAGMKCCRRQRWMNT